MGSARACALSLVLVFLVNSEFYPSQAHIAPVNFGGKKMLTVGYIPWAEPLVEIPPAIPGISVLCPGKQVIVNF